MQTIRAKHVREVSQRATGHSSPQSRVKIPAMHGVVPAFLRPKQWGKMLRMCRGLVNELWDVHAKFESICFQEVPYRATGHSCFQQCSLRCAIDETVLASLRPRQTNMENPKSLQRSSERVVERACKLSEQTMSGASPTVQPATAAPRVASMFQRCTELFLPPCALCKWGKML